MGKVVEYRESTTSVYEFQQNIYFIVILVMSFWMVPVHHAL